MSVAVAPGTPAPAAALVNSPAPEGADGSSEAADAVVGPSADDGDPEALRAKARELLFSGKSEEEVEAELAPKAKPAAVEKPKVDDDIALSKQWARLTAQETRLKERQKAHLTEVESLKAEREMLLKERSEREALQNDPVAFLQKAGWDKEKIVQWIQSDGKIEPELLIKQISEKHQKEIEELRAERSKERTELDNARRERAKAETEAALGDEVLHMSKSDPELTDLRRLLEKNPKKFEPFIKNRVGSILQEVWKKTFDPATGKGTLVDPREALVYLQAELAELQLAPGQAPAARTANPGAVEPSPITNHATSQRTVRSVDYDEMDPEARRARSEAFLRGEIEE